MFLLCEVNLPTGLLHLAENDMMMTARRRSSRGSPTKASTPAIFEDPDPLWPVHRHALVSSPQSPGGSYRDDAYWHPLHEGYDAWCKAEQEAAREVATRTLQAHVRRTKARIDFSRHRNAALWLQRVHRGQTSRSSGLPLPSDTQLARLEMRFGDAAQPKERIRFLNAVVPCLGCFI